MGFVVGKDEEIRCGFTGGVRACGIQRRVLAERTRGAEASVYLISGDLYEFGDFMLTSRFEEASRALDICADERRRIQNRAIYVRFGGKVHHSIESVAREQILQLSRISDIASHKLVPWVSSDFFHVPQISCIREQVVIHHINVFTPSKDIPHEAGSDETGSPGDENLHHMAALNQKGDQNGCEMFGLVTAPTANRREQSFISVRHGIPRVPRFRAISRACAELYDKIVVS
jgi:hypothetical protein